MNIASPSELVKTVGFAHTATTTAREPIAINSRLLIPINSRAANEHNAFAYETEVDNVATAASQAWAVNAPVYWDADNKVLTTTASTHAFFGFALQPKGADVDVSGLVAFNSYFSIPPT